MNKSIEGDKNKAIYKAQGHNITIKPKYKQTENIRDPEAYYKSKLKWKAINDGQRFCPNCKQLVKEEEAMEGRDGNLLHEACYEPGESNY